MYAYEEPPGVCGKFNIVDIQNNQTIKRMEPLLSVCTTRSCINICYV